MMSTLYKVQMSSEQKHVLDRLRSRISDAGPGVTLSGNRLTIRIDLEGELCEIHTIIESVSTPTEAREHLKEYHDWLTLK